MQRPLRRSVVLMPVDEVASAARYHDRDFGTNGVKILPGAHYVTNRPDEMLVTVLGSCVSACIRDPFLGLGGMNHFMLPESSDGSWGKVSAGMRYGNFAMEQLVNDILARGGRRERLEVKVFGGANVLAGMTGIGDQNADFVEGYLAAEGLPVAARHLRGRYPRRIHYFPADGKVFLRELRRADEPDLKLETRYQRSLREAPVSGEVELFE